MFWNLRNVIFRDLQSFVFLSEKVIFNLDPK